MQERCEQGSTHLNCFASSNSKRSYLEFRRKRGAPQVCLFRSKDEKPTFPSRDVQNQPDEEAEITQLQIIVAGSHLILLSFLSPVETTPGFSPWGHHAALRDQPDRKGNSKLSYWTYFCHLLSSSSLDTHFGDLIFP